MLSVNQFRVSFLPGAKIGNEQVRDRRIGRNELSAIKVCLAYVDAQREYATRPL